MARWRASWRAGWARWPGRAGGRCRGPGRWPGPGAGSGPARSELLFARLAGPLAGPATPGAAAFGRLLVALDGTLLDVPHTPANIAAFGPPPAGGGRGGFPQVRLVTLAACGTRGAAGCGVPGPARGPAPASRTWPARSPPGGGCGPGMLVLADRNFCGYPAAAALAATGADVLIRAKSGQRLPVLEALPDGSYRSVLPHPAAARAWTPQ